MKIAMFDQQQEEGKDFAKLIGEMCQSRGHPAEIVNFNEMADLTFAFCDVPFDMVFLEIDNMTGVETARKIRELSRDCPIILISGSTDFGVEGFRLQAAHYLMKPIRLEQLNEALSRAFQMVL